MSDRISKSVKNVRIVFIFYFIFLFLSFFSRKIFLDSLGNEFVGLTGTLQNILGLLSLAELGIGTAVSFHLYKPLEQEDREGINKIISLFGWLYKYIGLFILGAGVVVSLFFPLIFKNVEVNIYIIYYAFFVFLTSSLIGYFINFRQILLGADQKSYVVSAYLQTGLIIKILVQMLICKYYTNYFIWLTVEIVFAYLSCVILNRKIDKEYPWLQLSLHQGNEYRKEFLSIIRNVKQIFIHKMKDFLLSQSDQILVFAFVSLKMVTYYGNYSMVFSKATMLFIQVFNSISASVGNLIAEGNKDKIVRYFWELSVVRFYISGVIVALCYFLMKPFIQLWLGEEYVLPNGILILLCVNTYLMLTRGVVDTFNHSYGLYSDVWSAWTEAIINIAVTVILAIPYGLVGILLGKIASLLFIVVWWKPFYLFTQGIKLPVLPYFKRIIGYYLIFGGILIVCCYIIQAMAFNPSADVWSFLSFALFCGALISIIYACLMYLIFPEMRNTTKRILTIVKNKLVICDFP